MKNESNATECSDVTETSATNQSVPCTAVRQLAEWMSEIEASTLELGTGETEYMRGFMEHMRATKRKLKRILDANSETRHEAGMPIS